MARECGTRDPIHYASHGIRRVLGVVMPVGDEKRARVEVLAKLLKIKDLLLAEREGVAKARWRKHFPCNHLCCDHHSGNELAFCVVLPGVARRGHSLPLFLGVWHAVWHAPTVSPHRAIPILIGPGSVDRSAFNLRPDQSFQLDTVAHRVDDSVLEHLLDVVVLAPS